MKINYSLATILGLLVSTICLSQIAWRNPGPGAGSDLHFMAIQPDDANVIYVGGDIEGLFKTTDGGVTWNDINSNMAHTKYGGDAYWTNDIVIDPVNYQKIYYCTGVGLYLTIDGGQNWSLLYPSSYFAEDDVVSVSTVAVDPNNTNKIFMGLGDNASGSFADFFPFNPYDGYTGLYLSTNGGSSWSLLTTGIPDSTSIHSIIIDPLGSDTVLVTTSNGVYRSDDGGTTWAPKTIGLPHNNCYRAKAVTTSTGVNIYMTVRVLGTLGNASSFSGGIYKTPNMGDSWTSITSNLPKYDAADSLFYDYWKFDVNEQNPNSIYIGTTRGSGYDFPGIFHTDNGGGSWSYMYMPILGGWFDTAWFWDPYVFDLKIAPSDTSEIVMCMDQVEISHNAGQTWSPAFSNSSGGAWIGNGLELLNTDCIGFDPFNSNTVYVGYDDVGLFKSDDNATSFQRMDSIQDPIYGTVDDIDGVKDILTDPSNGDLYISRWQGSQGGYIENYTSGGIVLSTDNGISMNDISVGLPAGRCDIALDTVSGVSGNRTIYAAVYKYGVYRSTNSGSSWTTINTGLGVYAQDVWAIAVNPTNPQNLLLGVNTRGGYVKSLFQSSNGGNTWILVTTFPVYDVLQVYYGSDGTAYASGTDDFEWSTTGDLMSSTDGGATWNSLLSRSRIIDFQVSPDNNNVIAAINQPWYLVSYDFPAVLVTNNGGGSWTDISQNTKHTFFNFVAFNPANAQQLFVGTAGGGLWVADDISSVTGIDQSTIINHLVIYPNPGSDVITILGLGSNSLFVLYDVGGKEVVRANCNGLKNTINISTIDKGMYTYTVTNSNGIYGGKLVVQ